MPGRKALSGERGLPLLKGVEGVRLTDLPSEHSFVEMQDTVAPVEMGDKIEIWVHFSDATVQLHERMDGIREAEVEEELSIGR